MASETDPQANDERAAPQAAPPWPYPEAGEPLPSQPTWDCPGATCTCDLKTDEERREEHTIVLFDPQGVRMSGARVRVFEHGQLITDEPASANGAGEINVQIRESTATLYVEWAPASLPRHEHMPYRQRYHVRLGVDWGLATDRRLWNLGFGQKRRREDNIRDYQRAYSQPETGNLNKVVFEVRGRVDEDRRSARRSSARRTPRPRHSRSRGRAK